LLSWSSRRGARICVYTKWHTRRLQPFAISGNMSTSFLVRLQQSNLLYVENYIHPPHPKNWTKPQRPPNGYFYPISIFSLHQCAGAVRPVVTSSLFIPTYVCSDHGPGSPLSVHCMSMAHDCKSMQTSFQLHVMSHVPKGLNTFMPVASP